MPFVLVRVDGQRPRAGPNKPRLVETARRRPAHCSVALIHVSKTYKSYGINVYLSTSRLDLHELFSHMAGMHCRPGFWLSDLGNTTHINDCTLETRASTYKRGIRYGVQANELLIGA